MKNSNLKRLNIVMALLFAIAILIAAYVFKNNEYKQTIIFLIIAVWIIPFNYLTVKINNSKPGHKKCK
ncbi:MAG: hypothetical protein JKY19_03610 [Alcanivoracaceae bacterium]|nr:hypothetical protein [Alcanivoracaceae bacterium]